MTEFRFDGDLPGRTTVLLAHGAGAGMDTPFMTAIAEGLAARGLRVARFEFAYMAARRTGGSKRPPPKVEALEEEYRAAVADLACDGPLVIGGKSMGGRVASLMADELWAAGRIAGLLCLGYPFHPRGKPGSLRTAHLERLRTPALVCQGTRDPLGSREEVEGYGLPDGIALAWLEDGYHDLAPRRRMTALSQEDHLHSACDAVAGWLQDMARPGHGGPGISSTCRQNGTGNG
ncbi:alpha/beta family hydrolase [Mangrovicoccus sp. HB161399]|uniref:alpha/beta family hydrolase n=1 Tax=Mangrovicoccus sp. HB161399 TaxID=2720392 RepID=UPI0015564044|nr:alpha/beta family hydrolase [Mangrovicoccus sp. HB161399]